MHNNYSHRVLDAAGQASLGLLAELDGVGEALVAGNGLDGDDIAILGHFQHGLSGHHLGYVLGGNTWGGEN